MINWIKISDEIPEGGKRLLYFFEGTGVWTGFYYGRDEDYPDSNDHVFGSNAGFLTGDVTHWCYIDYPEGEDAEWRVDADREFFEETKLQINKIKEPISLNSKPIADVYYPPISWTDPDLSEEE
tara:strand:- start:9096 stop:9467 length:372 start_codon:yes stop_codon:yes gene_type:complete